MSEAEREIDRRQVVSTRYIISSDELRYAGLDVRALIFGQKLRELLEAHPDIDVSTVRLEDRPFSFPGVLIADGLECRVTARKGPASA